MQGDVNEHLQHIKTAVALANKNCCFYTRKPQIKTAVFTRESHKKNLVFLHEKGLSHSAMAGSPGSGEGGVGF